MERFDFIVPSGYFCVTGYHLRHARLHGETLPFDWLDGVTPELFAGFLESRFRDFLELPQLIPEGKKEEGDGHYRFRMPSGVVFVHDFARPDPAEEFAEVKQKYDRRIKRLFDNSDPKQFWIGNTGVFNRMLSAYRLTFAARIRFWINRRKRKFSKNYDRM